MGVPPVVVPRRGRQLAGGRRKPTVGHEPTITTVSFRGQQFGSLDFLSNSKKEATCQLLR